jgi:hypothetical protein
VTGKLKIKVVKREDAERQRRLDTAERLIRIHLTGLKRARQEYPEEFKKLAPNFSLQPLDTVV